MLRKLKHAGKRAAKYQFVATLNQLEVQGTKSWQPNKLVVVWSRRKKRKSSSAQSWRPSIENPYRGIVKWNKHESLEIKVTFFRGQHVEVFEPKDWVFVIENETYNGKRKPVATVRVDMTQYVTDIPTTQNKVLQLKPLTRKLANAKLDVTFRCTFLSEGLATDTDMMSLVGSTASEDTIRLGDIDVGNLQDLDDTDIENSRGSSLDGSNVASKDLSLLTQQIEMLYSSVDRMPDGTDVDSKRSSLAEQVIKEEIKSSISSRHQSSSSLQVDSSSANRLSKELESRTSVSSGGEGESKRNSKVNQSDSSEATTPVQKRRLKSSDIIASTLSESPVLVNSPAQDSQKLLLKWCQNVTEGYRGVKVTNFTTSWRNGLALCALLHHCQPDLIDFEDLQSLNARGNIIKALHGFSNLNIPLLEEPVPTFISDKSSLISYLRKIKEHFHEEEESLAEKSDLGDIPEIQLDESSFQVQKSLRSFNLWEVRAKLMSDLVEKEDEDDVFSCAVDDVLSDENEEKLEGQDASGEKKDVVETENHSPPEFSENEPEISTNNILQLNALEKEVILIENNEEMNAKSPTNNENSSFNDSGLEKSPEFNIQKLPSKRFINKETNADSTEYCDDVAASKSAYTEKMNNSEKNIETNDQVKLTADNQPKTSDLEESLTETRETNMFNSSHDQFTVNESQLRYNRTFEDDISPGIKPVKVENDLANNELPIDIVLKSLKETDFSELFATDSANPSYSNHISPQEPQLHENHNEAEVEDTNHNFPATYEQTSSYKVKPQNDISPHSENKVIDIKVHLPTPAEVQPAVPELDDLQDFITSEFDSVADDFTSEKVTFRTDTVDVQEKVDGTEEKVAKKKKECERSEEEGLSDNEKKDKDLDRTVQELLKSSARRNKKAKTMELIEKAKAESLASKNKPANKEDDERRQEVRKRAQLLIEQTRATLDRTKKLSSDVTDAVAIETAKEEPPIMLQTLPKFSSAEQSIESDEHKTIEVLQRSSNPFEEQVDEPTHTSNTEEQDQKENGELLNPFLSKTDNQNDSGKTEPTFTPPVNQNITQDTKTIDSEHSPREVPNELDFSLLSASEIHVGRNVVETPRNKSVVKTTVVDDPLTIISSQNNVPTTISARVNPVITTSTPLDTGPFKYDSPAIVERTSTPENEDINDEIQSVLSPIPVVQRRQQTSMNNRLSGTADNYKRWSAAYRNKSDSTSDEVASVLKQLEKEKMSLEKEQRQVEERSTDVQIELQELKSSGSRYSKEREGEIMKEWFQLVHKKNSILRQQDQLALMEEEQDIIKQVEKVHKQLIPLMAIEDEMKSAVQKTKEQGLLAEKFRLINEQDRVMQEMNEREQEALTEEERFQTSLGENLSKVTQQDEKCAIM